MKGLNEMSDAEFAEFIATTPGLYKPAQGKSKEQIFKEVLATCQLAREFGLQRFTALSAFTFSFGRPALTTQAAIAIAKEKGPFKNGILFERTGEDKDLKVTAFAEKIPSGHVVKHTVTMLQAMKGGWTRNALYDSIGDVMLQYRAAMFLIRTHCPGILHGYYSDVEVAQIAHDESKRKVSFGGIAKEKNAETGEKSADQDKAAVTPEATFGAGKDALNEKIRKKKVKAAEAAAMKTCD